MTLKYSNSEALNEVLARGEQVRRKRERRRTAWYGVTQTGSNTMWRGRRRKPSGEQQKQSGRTIPGFRWRCTTGRKICLLCRS